jgi:hypothetical protein
MAERLLDLMRDLHGAWDCRWIRVDRRLIDVPERDQSDGPWLCVRPPGASRHVRDEECADCPFWEAADEPEDCGP